MDNKDYEESDVNYNGKTIAALTFTEIPFPVKPIMYYDGSAKLYNKFDPKQKFIDEVKNLPMEDEEIQKFFESKYIFHSPNMIIGYKTLLEDLKTRLNGL